jgi:chaperone modulatory protein CbpM
MNETISVVLSGSVVEEGVLLSTVELSRACAIPEQQIELWVVEGVLQPVGNSRDEWRFGGESLARMRVAARLARDLELNTSGVALALDLLDRIEALESRLHRAGMARGERGR